MIAFIFFSIIKSQPIKQIKISLPMPVSGQDLVQLIENARRYPQGSPKRQRALHKLLLVVQKLPKLIRDNHPNYPDALSITWEWFIKKIDEFEYDPNFPELVEEHLTKWINGTLYYRIKDAKNTDQKEKKLKTSLDKPIGNDEDNRTKGDTISNEDALIPTLDGLEGYIENQQRQKTERIGLDVELYIEKDPDNKLQQCHPKENPKCNAQVLAQRIFLKEPPDKLKPISREMDIKYQTLVSFWKRKGLPLLQEIVTELGYQPPKVS